MKNVCITALLFFFIQCDVLPSNFPVYQPGTPSAVIPNENKEFADLMEKDQVNKKQKTAEVLTYLLNDPEPEDPYTATVIENTSNCNIIVRLVSVNGSQIYNLPIPRNGKNHFKIAKGNYTLKSNVCEAKYYSQKSITEPLILKLTAN